MMCAKVNSQENSRQIQLSLLVQNI